ncbi:hypothetical protein Q7P37_008344 [Cladosporium fusiforme]
MQYPGFDTEGGDSDSSSSSSDASTDSANSTGIYGGQTTTNQQDDGMEGRISSVASRSGRNVLHAVLVLFHNYGDLRKWGWQTKEADGEAVKWKDNWNDALDMLKIPHGRENAASKARWKQVKCRHTADSVDYSDGDHIYPATGGRFDMLLNPKDGISIGFDSVGPAHTGQAKMAKIKPEDITPFKHLSDVRYLLWERECKLAGVPASSLNHHLASNIKDADTRDAVREVLGGFLMIKLPKWPGVVITEQEHEVEFTCLLGTPVGLAMGRFLAQRKDTMGNDRKIASIRLWQGVTRDISQIIEYGPPLKQGMSAVSGGGKGEPVAKGREEQAAASFASGAGGKDAQKSLHDALHLKQDSRSATNLNSTIVIGRTRRLTNASSNSTDGYPVQRSGSVDPNALNQALRDRVDPERPEHLPFAQTDDDSRVSLYTQYYDAGGDCLGKYNGPPGESLVLQRAEADGGYWRERLGSETISPDDEANIPDNFQEGLSYHGCHNASDWELPEFPGLPGLVPGFKDAQGRPHAAWIASKWIHKDPWVDDEDFILHSGSNASPPVYSDEEMGSPREANLQKHEGKGINEAGLTQLQLQDVWMFDWYQSCKLQGHPVSSLKHIIMLNIAEPHTMDVLKELMDHDISRWGVLPGTAWLEKSNEPLIGSKLGQAIAKLIVQRHRQFGSKRDLYGGRVWRTPPVQGAPQNDPGTVSMMFTLNDPPEELLGMQREEARSRGGSERSPVGLSGSFAPQKRPAESAAKGEPASQRRKGSWE